MADGELIRILKVEGVEAWNAFARRQRESSRSWNADLRNANLIGVSFVGANLHGADLSRADLASSDLRGANLSGADLSPANLRFAVLSGAFLRGTDLRNADLRAVDLKEAKLGDARLRGALLSDANLQGADLEVADLSAANLSGVDLHGVACSGTIFGGVDLGAVSGLASVRHRAASTLGTNTLSRSQGRISPVFLRGCGLANWEVEQAKLYDSDLSAAQVVDIQYEVFRLRTIGPIQINPVFLSHSHDDHEMVQRLHDELQSDGIRCWLDQQHVTAGPLEQQIDRAIRAHPTVILVLSEASIGSDWVMWEAEKARELEKETDRPALCPIALDKSWKDCKWPGWLRSQIKRYHVVPFDDLGFDEGYLRLRDGLGIYYPQGPPSDGL